ncbi:MAG: helix-turn-helix transcriptional regulator [Lentisphaeria bacterium]|nr:helix-turn-helix transcriptional regulator [Lentisphaeria bacterium]
MVRSVAAAFPGKNDRSYKEYFFKALWQRLTTFFSQNDTPFHPALLRAVKVIRTRFMYPYSADTIARHAGLSRSHLNALFHKQFACGITAYINSLRLEYAKELLSNPYLNIGEAAGRSGFPDANYFSRIFRKKFGLSPGEFREQLRTGTLINYEYSPPAPEPEFPTPGGGLHK